MSQSVSQSLSKAELFFSFLFHFKMYHMNGKTYFFCGTKRDGLKLRMRDSYTNPYESKRIECFEIFGLTKRIHETNLWKTDLRNESTIRIFGGSGHETNPRNKSLGFGFANPDSRIRQPGFVRIRFVV